MKLSPLRKQVESLNKELQSQNIQIKDLIGFLNKSTPKQKHIQCLSPRNYLTKISNKKQKNNPPVYLIQNSNSKVANKQNIERQSLIKSKAIDLSRPIKQNLIRTNVNKQILMTKSVTFHNIQNALTTRRYLKLSVPQKKLNSSCTFCRQTPNILTACSTKENTNKKVHPQTQTLKKQKYHFSVQSHKKQFKSLQKIVVIEKISGISKSKKKLMEKEIPKTQKKKNPLKQIGSNQMLNKNQIRNLIEKKSFPLCNSIKSKAKLTLKDQKTLTTRKKQNK